jgi:hypothetical protein
LKKLVGAAGWILITVPLIWTGCAKYNPAANDVIVNKAGRLIADRGFIAAGQRVQELTSLGFRDDGSPIGHGDFLCGDCHANAFGGTVISKQCPVCHEEQAAHLNHPIITTRIEEMCVICHMPKGTIDSDSTNKYVADVRTHVFKLRTTAEKKRVLFVSSGAGKLVEIDGGLTLDLACYQCHHDEAGAGGPLSEKTMNALHDKALVIHPATARHLAGEEAR